MFVLVLVVAVLVVAAVVATSGQELLRRKGREHSDRQRQQKAIADRPITALSFHVRRFAARAQQSESRIGLRFNRLDCVHKVLGVACLGFGAAETSFDADVLAILQLFDLGPACEGHAAAVRVVVF